MYPRKSEFVLKHSNGLKLAREGVSINRCADHVTADNAFVFLAVAVIVSMHTTLGRKHPRRRGAVDGSGAGAPFVCRCVVQLGCGAAQERGWQQRERGWQRW